NRRLGQEVELLHEQRQRLGVAQVLLIAVGRGAAHPVEVAAGREALPAAAQDEDACSRIVLDPVERLGEQADEVVVEGVVQPRPVQRQRRDAIVDGGKEVGHASYILKTPKRVGSIGALSAAEIPRPSTMRLSAGSMTPSSQIRALA